MKRIIITTLFILLLSVNIVNAASTNIDSEWATSDNTDPRAKAAEIIENVLYFFGIIGFILLLFGIIKIVKYKKDITKRKVGKIMVISGTVVLILCFILYFVYFYFTDFPAIKHLNEY